jgi:hypothetical protein
MLVEGDWSSDVCSSDLGTITGDAAGVTDQILALLPTGVNQVQIAVRANSCAEHCEQLERFATEVMPTLVSV